LEPTHILTLTVTYYDDDTLLDDTLEEVVVRTKKKERDGDGVGVDRPYRTDDDRTVPTTTT